MLWRGGLTGTNSVTGDGLETGVPSADARRLHCKGKPAGAWCAFSRAVDAPGFPAGIF
ncbi:hypothetical protein HMPREF9162_0839 [Selenomonas sp. oral taxon 137 str. F0430]|nr:hypothetical protein HMPREF9162_0839 [Selenomonas sp. oral taxon 137 str. F0430]